jgi:streptomycin 6-kinase
VRDASDADLVLKLVWPHPEAINEADALRAWNGHGAVRLHDVAAMRGTTALLLERCVPGAPLRVEPEHEQDVVIATLLRRLWIEPSAAHPFEQLEVMCEQWAESFEQRTVQGSELESGLAREGIELFRTLPSSATSRVLLCTDLHAGNVLRAEREPWLVIDPKPYVGDPTYDVLQHMLNCPVRLHADPRTFAARMAALLDLDVDRLMLWLFARCVQESPTWPRLADVAREIAPH